MWAAMANTMVVLLGASMLLLLLLPPSPLRVEPPERERSRMTAMVTHVRRCQSARESMHLCRCQSARGSMHLRCRRTARGVPFQARVLQNSLLKTTSMQNRHLGSRMFRCPVISLAPSSR